ncbi:MAG: ORF6N domain-containing protein [Candidatus Omnitrophica bacterium]|nr:ORF6N domain-containing protein [Candidatus Omnitrophota bacterium]
MASRKRSNKNISIEKMVEPKILVVRGQRVILDADLAAIYGVATRRFNEQVRRNRNRFPDDFMFRLTGLEARALFGSRSQIATLKRGQNLKYLPYAFTEEGAVMAANILKSPSAVRMSIFVVRAFLRMRGLISSGKDLAREFASLEKKLTGRLNDHEAAIVDILKRIMTLIDPPPAPPALPKRQIGSHVG